MKIFRIFLFVLVFFFSQTIFSATSNIPHPSGNILPNPDYKKYSTLSESEQKAVDAINYARSLEGVSNIEIPNNFSSLDMKEQIMYLINKEREDRGLPKFRAREYNVESITQPFVDNIAIHGFASNVHNDPVSGLTYTQRIQSSPNTNGKYAFIAEILAINIHSFGIVYEWMYNDNYGWNWAHRDTILGAYSNDQTYIGIGFADNYQGNSTQKVVAVDLFHPNSSFVPNIIQRQTDLENKIFGESVVLYSDLALNGVSCRIPQNQEVSSLVSNISGCNGSNYNDKISSIKIPHQQCVEFFSDSNFSGEKMIFCNEQKNGMPLDLSFVDKPVDKLSQFNETFSSLKTYSLSKSDSSKVFFFVDTEGFGYSSPVSIGTEISDARTRSVFSLGNDNISSFTIPSGVCVDLYEHIDFAGRKRVYCNNSKETNFVSFGAGQFENDQLSSVKIYQIEIFEGSSDDKNVQFWQHDNKTGNSAIFTSPSQFSDARNTDIFSVGNDDISSFEIAPRVCVDVFQDVNFGGFQYTYCNFSKNERSFIPLIGGFQENDNLSSVKIREISEDEKF